MSRRKKVPKTIDLGAVKIHLRTDEASAAIYDAVLEAVGEVFEGNILPDARALSPVGHEPVRPGSKRNRESLEVEVFGTKRGPFAKIYSTSGHGGFLEVGTRKMTAQPYIWPAFQMNAGQLRQRIQQKLAEARTKAGTTSPEAPSAAPATAELAGATTKG